MEVRASGFRAFLILWSGQFVSLAGSALSGFALGVRVYQLTGSVTELGLVYMLVFVPQILFSPFAGSLVDRWGRKRALLVSNGGSMIVALALAALLATHSFTVWNVYVATAAYSLLSALQLPAFGSTVPLLVSKQDLGRANGMLLLATSTSQVLAPVVAGFLLLAVKVQGIVLIDCLSFGAAVITVLITRIPRPRDETEAADAAPATLLGGFAESWRYVTARRGLVGLIAIYGAMCFFVGFADVLITPLVLAFASTGALGAVLSAGGVGMILGSAAMTVWRGPRRNTTGVLGFSFLLGLSLVIGALRPSLPLIGAAAFVFLGSSAILNVCYRNIWQLKVERRMLSRALALQNMLTTSWSPIAYLLVGPLADGLFVPLVGRHHVRSGALAALVGNGAGRGDALLLMVMGVLILISVAVAYMYRPLRRLEDDLPDAIDEETAAAPEPAAERI
jgi:MFS transporter, DHA3 family, macrolide efflux protein